MRDTGGHVEPLTGRRWLGDLVVAERGLLLVSTLAGMAAGTLTLVQLALLAWLVSRLLDGEAPVDAWPAFLALLAVLPLRALAQWKQETSGLEVSLRLRRRVRSILLDHLARLGPVGLSAHHSASLANQCVDHVESLDGYIARFLPQWRLALLLPLLVLVVVAWLDWLAALFLLLSAPLIPLFMVLVGMGAERLNRDQFAAVARLSGHFIDRVRGITTLQLFGRTAQATRQVQAAADDYRRLSMRTLRLAFLSSAVLEFFASVAIAVVAIYVGFGLLGYLDFGPAPALTPFTGLLVLLLAPEFFQPLRSLAQHYHDRAAALGAAEGLAALLGEAPEPLRSGRRVTASSSPGELVSLHGATVEHPGRGRVLGPVDLVVRPGDVLAVTGPSGAGKSTLLQLLAGFAGPGEGQRRSAPGLGISWMDQRPLLIQGSIADNLRLAANDASADEMHAALARAGLDELLAALPRGLDTSLGERGVGLSGGQAQRLALARIFLSAAPLVLLDEPTASLDVDTEAQVVEALAALAAEGRALVIATHHPALVAMAGQRLALVAGRPEGGVPQAGRSPHG